MILPVQIVQRMTGHIDTIKPRAIESRRATATKAEAIEMELTTSPNVEDIHRDGGLWLSSLALSIPSYGSQDRL